MSNETSNSDLQEELRQLNLIVDGFETLLRSITEHYEGIQQNLDALKAAISVPQADCNHLLKVLDNRRVMKNLHREPGVQKGGTG